MHGIDQHIVDAPGIDTHTGQRQVAFGDIPQASLEFLKDAQNIPAKGTKHTHRGTGKPMQFLQGQATFFEPAEHHPAAFRAEVASDVVLWVHRSWEFRHRGNSDPAGHSEKSS